MLWSAREDEARVMPDQEFGVQDMVHKTRLFGSIAVPGTGSLGDLLFYRNSMCFPVALLGSASFQPTWLEENACQRR